MFSKMMKQRVDHDNIRVKMVYFLKKLKAIDEPAWKEFIDGLNKKAIRGMTTFPKKVK